MIEIIASFILISSFYFIRQKQFIAAVFAILCCQGNKARILKESMLNSFKKIFND